MTAVYGNRDSAELQRALPEVANVEHYARIVKEKSTMRRLI